jgi:hypothetical protein
MIVTIASPEMLSAMSTCKMNLDMFAGPIDRGETDVRQCSADCGEQIHRSTQLITCHDGLYLLMHLMRTTYTPNQLCQLLADLHLTAVHAQLREP